MQRDMPHPYRVTAPMRAPRYFMRRWLAYQYAKGVPGSVTHHRDIYENGSTGPWEELEVKR